MWRHSWFCIGSIHSLSQCIPPMDCPNMNLHVWETHCAHTLNLLTPDIIHSNMACLWKSSCYLNCMFPEVRVPRSLGIGTMDCCDTNLTAPSNNRKCLCMTRRMQRRKNGDLIGNMYMVLRFLWRGLCLRLFLLHLVPHLVRMHQTWNLHWKILQELKWKLQFLWTSFCFIHYIHVYLYIFWALNNLDIFYHRWW